MEEVLSNNDLLQLIFSHIPLLSSFGREGFDPSFESVRRQHRFSQDLLYDDGSSWFFPPDTVRSVKLVCKQWHALATQQMSGRSQRAFEQLKQNVWTRMERRNTARAQLSAPEVLDLDVRLVKLLRKYSHTPLQMLDDGRLNALLEQGASPSRTLPTGFGYSISHVFSQVLQTTTKTMGEFVVLAELICAAEPNNSRMKWSETWFPWDWITEYEQVAERVLKCMSWRPWDSPQLSRRSFGLFRVAVLARLFHFVHYQPTPLRPHQERQQEQDTQAEEEEHEPPEEQEWVEDLSILFPTSTPIQVAQIIVQFAKHNPMKRRRRALLRDIIAVLQLAGIPLKLNCCEEGHYGGCSFGACLYHPFFPQDFSIVQLLRHSTYSNDLWRLLEEASRDDQSGEKRKAVTTALLKLLKTIYGRKEQRKMMKQVLATAPALRGWIVEEAPVIIQELCRMRCRELLTFFLEHERERMVKLLPSLLEFMRSDQVRGLKAKLICMLERALMDEQNKQP
ncbi:hypothetical protein QOT17_000688 [Balamuthia mandrillaris]